MYGPADEGESVATIHAALERGVSLIDTALFPEEVDRLEAAVPAARSPAHATPRPRCAR